MNILDVVDHLVYASPDLESGVQRIAGLLGAVAAPGGHHPGRGTRNALVALGPRTYLEIIAPDPDQVAPAGRRWFRVDDVGEPQLVTWAAPARDIESMSSRLAEAGMRLGTIGEGRRARADGSELRWRFTDPATVVCDGIVPFLIDWGTSPHPAETAPDGGRLVGLSATHPDPEVVRGRLQSIGVEIPIERGKAPRLTATIRTRGGEVELS